jgi:KUP system potassium uptake protein
MIAAILALLFLLWRYGKEQQWFAEAEDRFHTSHFISSAMAETGPEMTMRLTKRYGAYPLNTTRGLGIFFDKAGETTPIVFSQFVLKLTSMPEVIIFFHLRPLEMPSVQPDSRYTLSRLAVPNCYRLVVRYGYNDEIITPNLANVIVDQARKWLLKDYQVPSTEETTETMAEEEKDKSTTNTDNSLNSSTPSRDVARELAKLEAAYSHKVLYIIGKEQMKIKPDTSLPRRVLLNLFLWIRDNTRNKIANLRLPADRVIEVGFLKEI